MWAVELHNQLTAALDVMEALVSECISKSVHVQLEIPQCVHDKISMISEQNTFYDQMNKGVKTLRYSVSAQYAESILQSRISASNVKGEMAVIAAKASYHYESLTDAFHTEIPSNNKVLSRRAG